MAYLAAMKCIHIAICAAILTHAATHAFVETAFPVDCPSMVVGAQQRLSTTPCATLHPSSSGDDTTHVQHALDECAIAGGGVVTLAGGVFQIRRPPLQLRSHVTLHLGQTTTLQGPKAPGYGEYKEVAVDTPTARNTAKRVGLLSADDIHAFGVTADEGGIIDGQGTTWWTKQGAQRPVMLLIQNSTNFAVKDVAINNCVQYCVQLKQSQFGIVDGVHIANPPDSIRTGGIDLSGSSHIEIKNVDISTGDDFISIRGTRSSSKPLTDIYIHRSRFGRGHGISIGRDVFAGINNVCIAHNVIGEGARYAFRIRTMPNSAGPIRNYVVTHNTINKSAAMNAVICVSEGYTQYNPTDKRVPCPACQADFRGLTFNHIESDAGDLYFRGSTISATFFNCRLWWSRVYNDYATLQGLSKASQRIPSAKFTTICN